MLAAGIAPVPLDELEIHLREEIGQQIKAGMNEQYAFAFSVGTIGDGSRLKTEFEIIRAAEEASDWRMKEILFFASLTAFSLCLAAALVFKPGNLKELAPAQQFSALMALITMIACALGGRLFYWVFPRISKRSRYIACISAGALAVFVLVIAFDVVFQRVDFTVGQLIVALLWTMMPTFGILFGLISGIENSFHKKYEQA